MLKVVSYHQAISGYGPYWKVVDDISEETVGMVVSGCVYPADNFQTRRAAQTFADRTMKEANA